MWERAVLDEKGASEQTGDQICPLNILMLEQNKAHKVEQRYLTKQMSFQPFFWALFECKDLYVLIKSKTEDKFLISSFLLFEITWQKTIQESWF